MGQGESSAAEVLGNRDEVKATRKRAVLALAGGARAHEVCKALGVPRQTLYRWRQDPAFRAELNAWMDVAHLELGTALVEAGNTAIQAMQQIAADTEVKPAIRLNAAQAILDRLGKTASNPGSGGSASGQGDPQPVEALVAELERRDIPPSPPDAEG